MYNTIYTKNTTVAPLSTKKTQGVFKILEIIKIFLPTHRDALSICYAHPRQLLFSQIVTPSISYKIDTSLQKNN